MKHNQPAKLATGARPPRRGNEVWFEDNVVKTNRFADGEVGAAMVGLPVGPIKWRVLEKWIPGILRHQRLLPSGGCWGDHMGMITYEGQDYLVAEPYDLSMGDVEQLQKFCSQHGLRYVITATSWHFPTRTLRIVLWPRDRDHAGATVGTNLAYEAYTPRRAGRGDEERVAESVVNG